MSFIVDNAIPIIPQFSAFEFNYRANFLTPRILDKNCPPIPITSRYTFIECYWCGVQKFVAGTNAIIFIQSILRAEAHVTSHGVGL